jgi:hypothetical protein
MAQTIATMPQRGLQEESGRFCRSEGQIGIASASVTSAARARA